MATPPPITVHGPAVSFTHVARKLCVHRLAQVSKTNLIITPTKTSDNIPKFNAQPTGLCSLLAIRRLCIQIASTLGPHIHLLARN